MIIIDIIYVLLYIPLIWLSPIVSKRMHESAVRKGWKKPEEYKTFGNILIIIPAQGVCRLLTDHTPDSFYLHGLSTRDSWDKWVFSMLLFLGVYLCMLLFAVYIQKRFILKTTNTTPVI